MRPSPDSLLPDSPELAADLEWMLQSGQAPPSALAGELARTYFRDLARWLALSLDDPDRAADFSLEAIMAAALNAYRLPGDISSQVWVFQQAARLARRALRTSRWQRRWRSIFLPGRQIVGFSTPETYLDAALWLAIDQLPDDARLAAGLAWGLSLELAAIALILGLPELEVERMLAQATRSALNSLATFGLKLDDLPEQPLDLTVRESLARRAGQLQPESLDVEILAAEISAEIDRQVGRQSFFARWKEFVWLGLVAVLILGLFWVANQLLPEEDPVGAAGKPGQIGQQTPPGSPSYQAIHLDYHASPGETVEEIGQALGLQSSEIVQLLNTYSKTHLDLASPLRIELLPPAQFPQPTPVAPVAHPQAPLTMDASPDQIRNRMTLSPTMWKTLWLDAVNVAYGPDGSVDSARQSRIQSWYSQPDLNLMVIWVSGSDLTYAILRKNGLRFTSYQQGWLDARQDSAELPYMAMPEEVIFPNHSVIFSQPGPLRVVGEDRIAGRQVIVVDWPGDDNAIWPEHFRTWVDVQTGIILRGQYYSGPNGDTLLGEVIVENLALDVDFPQADLFTPWGLQKQVFVSDYRGEQVDASVLPLPTQAPEEAQSSQARRTLPPDFDPSHSQLDFRYELSSRPGNQPSKVAVFADPYYLGDVQLSDPWSVYCVRSPDGRKVAYSFNPYGGPLIGSGWFELASPLAVKTGTFQQQYGIFSFAPDSRRLAFFGRDPDRPPGSLIVIDTVTDQEQVLADFHTVASLFWSPDGERIAILAAPDDSWSQMQAVSLDAATGEVLYQAEVEPDGFWDPASRSPDWPAPDWPGRDWGESFSPVRQGLSACASPP